MPTICIHCDSESSIGRAQSNMYNDKSRHIRRWHINIIKLLFTRVNSIVYVNSKDDITNPLTKGFTKSWSKYQNNGLKNFTIRWWQMVLRSMNMKNVYMSKRQKLAVILCLYFDGMLIIRSDNKMVRFTNNILKSSFDMIDMDLANVILGIKNFKDM